MNLYEIPHEVDEAFSLYLSSFDPETGEQTATDEETEERLVALKDLQNKKDDIVKWALSKRANAIADINAVQAELDRIKKIALSAQKTADKMENMLTYFLPPEELTEMTQYGNWKIGYKKSEATKVQIIAKIPDTTKKKELVPGFDLIDLEDEFKEKWLEYKIEETAVLKDVKKWIEDEEEKIEKEYIDFSNDEIKMEEKKNKLEELHNIAYIEKRNNLQIK